MRTSRSCARVVPFMPRCKHFICHLFARARSLHNPRSATCTMRRARRFRYMRVRIPLARARRRARQCSESQQELNDFTFSDFEWGIETRKHDRRTTRASRNHAEASDARMRTTRRPGANMCARQAFNAGFQVRAPGTAPGRLRVVDVCSSEHNDQQARAKNSEQLTVIVRRFVE